MRILHLLNDVRCLGNGIVNMVVDLACLQAKDGQVVAVASSGGEYGPLLNNHGVTLFNFEQRDASPGALLRIPIRWRSIVREFKPDVVHAHMRAGAMIARYLKYTGKYRLVTTVHKEFERKEKLMGVGERVIVLSRKGAATMAGLGIPEDRLRVVLNGTLGSPRGKPRSDYETATLQGRAIITVCGMYVRKGVRELISAFDSIAAEFPDAHLYLVGDGPDRALFEAQAAALPSASRIHFEGFQPEPLKYMKAAELFVLASHREPFGLVITEAMEAGCPVIASDVDGIPEILGWFGEYGLLIPPSDVPRLAGAMSRLLSRPQERDRLRAAGMLRANAYRAERVARETTAVYSELLKADHPAQVRMDSRKSPALMSAGRVASESL